MAEPYQHLRQKVWWPALRTSGIYALVALAWIFLSDWTVAFLVSDPRHAASFHSFKGSVFVLVTASILFLDRLSGDKAALRERQAVDERQAKASKDLRASEQRFRHITEASPLGIALRGADMAFKYVNPRFEELFGYRLEEVSTWEAWSANAYPDPSYRALKEKDWLEDFRTLPTDDRIHKRSLSVTCRDGTVKAINLNMRRLEDGSFLMTYEDITARRAQHEAERAASTERLAMLEAASLARVVPWSMDERGWMQWGESLESVFDWKEARDRRHAGWPWDRIHPDDHLRLRIALAQADKGFVSSFECRMSGAGKGWAWTRWTLAAEDGRYHGAVQDIDDQHEIQAQLLQTQKLESLGTLVGGITHDFNNLLMAILGFSELLLQNEGLDPRQRHALETIHRAAGRGRTLIDQVLGFSRKLPARRVQASLNGVVEEAARLLRHALSSRVELSLALEPSLPEAPFDTGQVHQVIMNLALNARDAIQDAGTIRIRTGLEEVGPEVAAAHGCPPGPYLLLEVEDDGVGIPADASHRIFEPFFTTKGSKGTGLGLSMAHGIVMEHGGFVDFRSQVGAGTTMRVRLPLTADPGQGSGDRAKAAPALGILVLAADPGLRERLTETLALLGQRADPTETPAEALDRIRGGAWDVLVVEPTALPDLGRPFLRALEGAGWKGALVSAGTRLDPAFQPLTLGHLGSEFTLFDLVEVLDRVPLDGGLRAHPAP